MVAQIPVGMCSVSVVFLCNHLAPQNCPWKLAMALTLNCQHSYSTHVFNEFIIWMLRSLLSRLQRKIGEVCWNCRKCGRCIDFLDLEWIHRKDYCLQCYQVCWRPIKCQPMTGQRYRSKFCVFPTHTSYWRKRLLPTRTLPIFYPDQLVGHSLTEDNADTTKSIDAMSKEKDQ